MKKPVYLILEEANACHRIEDRAKVLQNNSCKTLKTILDYTFHPKVKWLLPEGKPPFEESRDPTKLLNTRLHMENKRLSIFVENGKYPNLRQNRREQLFLEILENVHPKDAQLLLEAKDKNLKSYKRITPEVVRKAFPIFTKHWGDEVT